VTIEGQVADVFTKPLSRMEDEVRVLQGSVTRTEPEPVKPAGPTGSEPPPV
jgi:hypothetical protein